MKDELITSEVVIAAINDQGKKIEIVAEAGSKFSFFKEKTEGGQTKAFETFVELALEVGSAAVIKYSKAGNYGNINSVAWFQAPQIETPTTHSPKPNPQIPIRAVTEQPMKTDYENKELNKGMAMAETALYAACYSNGDSYESAKVKVNAALENIYKTQVGREGSNDEILF